MNADHVNLLSRRGCLLGKGCIHSVHSVKAFPVRLEVLLCNDKWKSLKHQSVVDYTHYILRLTQLYPDPKPGAVGTIEGLGCKLYFSVLSVSYKDSVYGTLTFSSQPQPAAKDNKYTQKS